MQNESIVLNYVDGASAKTYQCQLEGSGEAWTVKFQYGRIGSTLTAGSKTPTPVAFDKAKSIFDKLVREKKSKGYSETDSGRPYQEAERAGEHSGFNCQLLNAIARDGKELDACIDSREWCMEIKLDGERRLIEVTNEGIVGINRKGFYVALDEAIVADVEAGGFAVGTLLDGEDMGDGRFGIFDVLNYDGEDIRAMPYSKRLVFRQQVVARSPRLGLIATAFTTEDKAELFTFAVLNKQEGVVLKRLDSTYLPGRPASGGSQLKCKLVESATLRVAGLSEGKRSVTLEGQDDAGNWRALGAVTIPPNKAVPAVGDVVEIEYLFAHRTGSVYQPVYLRPRPDQDAGDCSLKQLKYVEDRTELAPAA